jgi:hypothetical protein
MDFRIFSSFFTNPHTVLSRPSVEPHQPSPSTLKFVVQSFTYWYCQMLWWPVLHTDYVLCDYPLWESWPLCFTSEIIPVTISFVWQFLIVSRNAFRSLISPPPLWNHIFQSEVQFGAHLRNQTVCRVGGRSVHVTSLRAGRKCAGERNKWGSMCGNVTQACHIKCNKIKLHVLKID